MSKNTIEIVCWYSWYIHRQYILDVVGFHVHALLFSFDFIQLILIWKTEIYLSFVVKCGF